MLSMLMNRECGKNYGINKVQKLANNHMYCGKDHRYTSFARPSSCRLCSKLNEREALLYHVKSIKPYK